MKRDSGTRSGLLWQVERILKELKQLNDDGLSGMPDVLLMENVPQVVGEQNLNDFKDWMFQLEKLGYSNYWQILNAKDYGIPQNRQRCFMVSIHGEYNYNFPKKQELKLCLNDMLEEHVDEKYFLSDKMIKYISATNDKWTGNNNGAIINKKIASTLNTGEGSKRCDASNYVSDELPENFDLQKSLVGGDKLLIKNATKKGYLEAEAGDGIDISTRMETHRGTVQKGICQTIKTQCDVGVVVKDE